MMIGAVAGYFGGRVDLFIMRIVDIIYSLPDMLVIILLAVVLGQVLHVEGTILEKSARTSSACSSSLVCSIGWAWRA